MFEWFAKTRKHKHTHGLKKFVIKC